MIKGKKEILLKWAVVLIVFAMIWLSLGSLVNFHQHRLYGKLLISELVAYTPQKKSGNSHEICKSLKSFETGFTLDQSGIDALNAASNTVFRCFILFGPSAQNHFLADCPRSTGLRAPPSL